MTLRMVPGSDDAKSPNDPRSSDPTVAYKARIPRLPVRATSFPLPEEHAKIGGFPRFAVPSPEK